MAIIGETGHWDFSLREVARRAGVSKNAPYRHFADKQALLEEMAVAGFGALRAAGAAALQGTTTPPDMLLALGRAYIGWGMANPALYRLMFGQTLAGTNVSSDFLEEIDKSRQILRKVLEAGAMQGMFKIDVSDETKMMAAATTAWSLVHGFTLLTIDNVLQRNKDGSVIDGLPELVIRFFVSHLEG